MTMVRASSGMATPRAIMRRAPRRVVQASPAELVTRMLHFCLRTSTVCLNGCRALFGAEGVLQVLRNYSYRSK